MMKFKLLAGIHVGPDYSQKPVTIKDKDGNVTGEKYPSKQYRMGSTVYDRVNLAEKHGADKFQLMPLSGKDRQAFQAMPGGLPQPGGPQFAHPGGQVVQGHQETTKLPDGRQVSGPQDETNLGDDEDEEGNFTPENHGKSSSMPGKEGDEDDEDNDKPGAKPVQQTSPQSRASTHQELEKTYGKLEQMSVKELQQVAETEEIDLKGAKNKEQILKIMRSGK